MQPYDVIYVHKGDGTTTWQDRGIVIDKPGVKLIGSGVDLVLDGGAVTGVKAGTASGLIISRATSAPDIANTSTQTQFVTSTGTNEFGHGVAVIANDIYVGGLNIHNTQGSGIRIYADSNTGNISATIENNTTSNAVSSGIIAVGTAGAAVNVKIHDNIAFSNGSSGIYVQAGASSGATGTAVVEISGNQSYANASDGFSIISRSPGSNIELNLYNNYASDNSVYGYQMLSFANLSGTIETNIAQNSTRQGFLFQTGTAGTESIVFQNNRAITNARDGVFINDDSTNTINIDMGGGTLGSYGRNSIYGNGTAGNPYRDLALDLDNGSVFAQSNWWGQAGGPVAGRVRNEGACPSCGTADTSGALNAAPTY